MQIFDKIDPATLERRDWQLWTLAIATILILTSGLALLMYPAVFSSPLLLDVPALRRSFVGFCILSFLLVGYLLERHLVIRRLRRQLAEELKQKARILEQSSADLLATLPGFSHFQDRLAMEFRRAANTQQPLSLLIAGLRLAPMVADAGGTATVLGDAAKVLIRRLRREDSIYLFRPGVFGILLPGVSGAHANRVADRLQEGLTDAAGASNRFTAEIRMLNYPEHAATARELEQMGAASFPENPREPGLA